MTSGRKYTLGQIARKLGGTVRGDSQLTITGPAAIDQASPGTITFLEDPRLAKQLQTTGACAVVVRPGAQLPEHLSAVEVDRPAAAFARVLQMFTPALPCPQRGIDQSAVVQAKCSIAEDAAIGPHCFVGGSARIGRRTVIHHNVHIAAETTIGQDCIIYPGVVIRERTTIGDRVIIHPNAVIGADGFGYNFVDGRHEKVPQIGSVIIEKIFSIPSMGLLAFEAVTNRDYNVVMAVATMGAMVNLLGLMLADIAYAIADPRISFESAV